MPDKSSSIPVEVIQVTHYEGLWQYVYDFQALIAGLSAAGIAAITIRYIYAPVLEKRRRTSKLENRKRRVGCHELSNELELIAKRARQGPGTIKVHKASNANVSEETKEKMLIPVPRLIEDGGFMELRIPG